MRTSLLSLTALLAIACGSSPNAGPTKTPESKKEIAGPESNKTAPLEAAGTSYDLSPVREPEDVVALLSWKSPKAMVATFSDCAALPQENVLAQTEVTTRNFLREVIPQNVDARQLAAAVALDAPIFGMAALEPQSKRPGAFVAVSVGLVSLEKAKQAVESAGPVTELGPGLWRVAGRTSPTCVIAASAGATPARLVCGPKEKDVTALAPYLTRTLPTAAAPAQDMHLEVRVLPAEARFGPLLRTQIQGLPVLAQAELSIGEPTFDKAIVDAASGIADEVVALVADADKLTIDATMDPATCLHATAALSVRGKSSWTASMMGERPERAGAPPEIFWRAPKDSASVFYGRGADPKRFSPILKTVRSLVEGALDKFDIGSDADQRALVDLIDWPMGRDVVTVSATGSAEATEAKDKKRTPQEEANAIVGGILGWSLIGYEEGSAAVAKQMKAFADVYARKGFQTPLKTMVLGMAGKDAEKLLPKVKVKKGPASLGADSLDLEIKIEKFPAKAFDIKGATEKDLVNLELHVLLMPDGKSRTWIAFGAGNPDALVKRLLSVKQGAPDAETIASRKDLEPLRRGSHMGAGFVTLNPLLKSLKGTGSLALRRRGGEFERVMRSLSTLPHQGDTPIFVTTSVTGADAPRGDVSVDVSKGTLEDIGWLMKTMPR